MALIWCDGFDHYGLDTSGNGQAAKGRMLDGVYAQVNPASSLTGYGVQDSISRTGGRAYRDQGLSGIGNRTRIRRVFGGARLEVGVGMAFYMEALPGTSNELNFCQFRDVDNNDIVTFTQDTTGVIRIKQGNEDGALLADSGTPALVAEAWQHVECFVSIDDVYGYAECRVNGQTVAVAVDVDFGTVGAAQWALSCNLASIPPFAIDDLYAWDTSGSFNNDFLGDLRVRTLLPDGDTVNADWVPMGPTLGFEAINDSTPDDETSYIEAAPVTPPAEAVSDFELQDVPIDVASILAVQTYVRMRKSQAGDCDIQVSMISAGDVAAGTDRPITEAWTYWTDVFETDPDTGALWTPAALDAANLRIARTA